ncbi:hypothetical protein HHK36_005560 [Tetracentron sinense]|uniref:Gnk2-homologous domain-containing protein n=1 Tax=Tetracentron sinense TaxID=13715 RepID=A0A834ZKV4_TETSI|nr:hypothetical protein HHK36_005560 [Tetracentron sinense]
MLRFSNQSIFSILQESPGLFIWNTQNVSDPSGFNQLLADTMDSLATPAASGQSRMKFATGEANFTRFQTLYSLVQCTPDLSSSDCNRCLEVLSVLFQITAVERKREGFDLAVV